jgi:translation initiation factor 2-alpha kinase 4
MDGDNVDVFRLYRQHSQPEASPSDHEQEVRVLVAGTKSKKSNRRNIVEQAQGRAATCECFHVV